MYVVFFLGVPGVPVFRVTYYSFITICYPGTPQTKTGTPQFLGVPGSSIILDSVVNLFNGG